MGTNTAHPTTSTAHQTTTTAYPTYILTAKTDYSSKDEPKHKPNKHKDHSSKDEPKHSDDQNMKPKHDEPSKDHDDDHSKDDDGNYGVAYSGQSCSNRGQCSTGCCEGGVCVHKKKDWTNIFLYCPAECVGEIFGKAGTCQ